jgi:hypothetical protein
MPRGTFVIFHLDRFPEPGNTRTYKTEEKRPRASHDQQADPVYTTIRIPNQQVPIGADYSRASVVHRKGVKIEGVWHGHIITEVVEQRKFDGYFNRQRRTFIGEVEKEIAMSAAEALNSDPALGQLFRFRKIELDFSQITPRAINVIGAWFKGMRYTNIRTEAAFGNHITVDPEFRRMAQHGNQSNLILVIDFGGTHLKVNISRAGSAFFMQDCPLETCLAFMEHLLAYERVPNPPQV